MYEHLRANQNIENGNKKDKKKQTGKKLISIKDRKFYQWNGKRTFVTSTIRAGSIRYPELHS